MNGCVEKVLFPGNYQQLQQATSVRLQHGKPYARVSMFSPSRRKSEAECFLHGSPARTARDNGAVSKGLPVPGQDDT